MHAFKPRIPRDISKAGTGPAADSGPMGDPSIEAFVPRMRLWMLRILCDCGVVWSDGFNASRFISDTRGWIPFDEAIDPNELSDLHRHYKALLTHYQSGSEAPDGSLAANLDRLASVLRFGPVERDILAVLVLYGAVPCFEHLVDVAFPNTDSGRITWQLARVLGCSQHEVEAAISPSSILVSAGLIQVNEGMSRFQLGMVMEINRRVLGLLTRSTFDMEDLMRCAARPARESTLTLTDFGHMSEQRDLVRSYLRAVRAGKPGRVSVLLDGPPGVGKSELARCLAVDLGYQAFEINEVDSDGDPAMPGERVQYLRICQRLLERNDNGLIVFDEADAVISGPLDGSRGPFRGSKAGLIHMLESLALPVIWITNHGDLIDPAILRRIDLTIRFRPLPQAARQRMLERTLAQQGIAPKWLQAFGRKQEVTPARIAQADRVARLIAGDDPAGHDRLMRQVLEENLDLRETRHANRDVDKARFELGYRLDLVNADEDLPDLVSSLKRSPVARICLYGPPGTGKTRFVRHLAQGCGLKLAEYRASDLIDKFVGQSERNIRSMFEEADRSDTLLFLDEADSLIASRSQARHSWEVNQVNELLKGLEGFGGLFVASTNLMERLDPAVMRRLDFKIHFGWLKPDQRWRLFLDLAAHLGFKVRGSAARRLRQQMDRLDYLAPGDFAMLARRLTIRPTLASADELAELLGREMDLKPVARANSGIGFTARVAARN